MSAISKQKISVSSPTVVRMRSIRRPFRRWYARTVNRVCQTHQALGTVAVIHTNQSRLPRAHLLRLSLIASITRAISHQYTKAVDTTKSGNIVKLQLSRPKRLAPSKTAPVPNGTTTRLNNKAPSHISHLPDERARG